MPKGVQCPRVSVCISPKPVLNTSDTLKLPKLDTDILGFSASLYVVMNACCDGGVLFYCYYDILAW